METPPMGLEYVSPFPTEAQVSLLFYRSVKTGHATPLPVEESHTDRLFRLSRSIIDCRGVGR
ncbi:MAG: hypothetical protein Q8O76_00140, partial [Chloroflexota bacterium]|nr:hypothetical protein [Chloroflexota bacterium]